MEIKDKPKIWQTAVLLVLAMLGLMYVGGYSEITFGMYGSLITEGLMLILAVLFVWSTRGSMRDAFKFKRPSLRGVWGSLLIYFGSYIIIMAVTLVVSYIMPDASSEVSESLYYFFTNNMPPIATFLILSLPPAFCEEMLFRGAVVYGLKGLKKWTVVIIVGVIFGIFHRNIIRVFPTAILGVAFTLVYLESENLFYPMLMHFINNAFSALSILFLSDSSAMESSSSFVVPFITVGIYFIFCTVSPFLIKSGLGKFKPKKLLFYHYAPDDLTDEDHKELERKKKINKIAVLSAVLFAVVGAGMIAFDRVGRSEILDVSSTIYVDYNDTEVANIDFKAEKDDIFYMEYDIKAERGLAEVVIASEGGEELASFSVQASSGNFPIALNKGEYTIKIYSHASDLWDFCRQNDLPYTEDGDLIKLNMAGNKEEKSEISYAFRIK